MNKVGKKVNTGKKVKTARDRTQGLFEGMSQGTQGPLKNSKGRSGGKVASSRKAGGREVEEEEEKEEGEVQKKGDGGRSAKSSS